MKNEDRFGISTGRRGDYWQHRGGTQTFGAPRRGHRGQLLCPAGVAAAANARPAEFAAFRKFWGR